MLGKKYILLFISVFCLLTIGCAEEEPKTPKQSTQQKQSKQQTPQNEPPQTQTETTEETTDTIEYFNEKYGFTLTLPATWNDKYVVKPANWEQQAEAIFDFNYQSTKTNLFSIIVLNMTKAEWDRDYASGLWGYLGERDGKIFAYSVPTELPSEWQEDKQTKVKGLVDVTQMVNIDVPRIVKTFKLIR